jgi:transposase
MNATTILYVSNKQADLRHLYETIEGLKSKTPGNSDVVFGMEATGIYSLPLYSDLTRDGHKVKLYNPIQTNLNLYQLRELVRIRDRLIDKQTICKVQLVRNIDTVWPDYSSVMKKATGATSIAILRKYSVPSKVRAESFEKFYELVKMKSRSKISRIKAEEIYTHAGNILTIPELDSIISVEIKILITELELFGEQIRSIEKRIGQMMKLVDSKIISIPGIGDTLGPMILGEIGNADRFPTAKKLIAFAGLDPIVSQSGRFENKSVAIQNDENLKRFYNKKISEGKHHFSALNAVAAKLLRIVYWVFKNNKEYQTQVN